MAGLADDARQLAAPLFHLLRMLFVHLEARLDNHHIAVVFLADVADVLDAVSDDVVGVQLRVAVHGPVGVERHAHHVPLATILQQGVEVVVIEVLAVAAVQVDDDDGVWKDLLHGIVAGTDESGILFRLCLEVTHGVGDGGVP